MVMSFNLHAITHIIQMLASIVNNMLRPYLPQWRQKRPSLCCQVPLSPLCTVLAHQHAYKINVTIWSCPSTYIQSPIHYRCLPTYLKICCDHICLNGTRKGLACVARPQLSPIFNVNDTCYHEYNKNVTIWSCPSTYIQSPMQYRCLPVYLKIFCDHICLSGARKGLALVGKSSMLSLLCIVLAHQHE